MISGDPTTANVIALVAMAYSIPSYILYISLVCTIFFSSQKNNFSSSFYKLFSLSAANNIIFHATTYCCLVSNNTPLFIPIYASVPETGFFLTFIPVLSYHTWAASNLIDFFISLNRCTVITLKTNYKEFWRKLLPWIFVIILVVPNLVTWHFWLIDYRNKIYNVSNPDQGYYWDAYAKDNVPWMNNSRNMSIVIFCCAIPSFLMNSYVCFHLIKQKFFPKAYSTKKYSGKQNIRLFIYSCLIFLTQVGSGYVQLAFTVSTDLNFLRSLFSFLYYTFDTVSLAPAWFLFIVNGTLRKATFEMCLPKKILNKSPSGVIVMPATNTNRNTISNRNLESMTVK